MLPFTWYVIIPVAGLIELLPTLVVLLPAFWWLAKRNRLNFWTALGAGAVQGVLLALPANGFATGQAIVLGLTCCMVAESAGALAA